VLECVAVSYVVANVRLERHCKAFDGNISELRPPMSNLDMDDGQSVDPSFVPSNAIMYYLWVT
jgi:hypothetical protein